MFIYPIKKVEKQNGIVRQFLQIAPNTPNTPNTKDNEKNDDSEQFNKSMQWLESVVIELIEKRLPVSDDLLVICFNYELQASLVWYF